MWSASGSINSASTIGSASPNKAGACQSSSSGNPRCARDSARDQKKLAVTYPHRVAILLR